MPLAGQPNSNLVLIGLRGSGKTTVGRLVAARMGRPFIDLDDLTHVELGADSIAAAFTLHGEPEFRAAEKRCLDRVLMGQGQVVALGGGTPTAPSAEDSLDEARRNRRAVIVYLRANAESLRTRLKGAGTNEHRPSLTGRSIFDEIDEILARRDPLYRRLADIVVEVASMSDAGSVATEIEGRWLSFRA